MDKVLNESIQINLHSLYKLNPALKRYVKNELTRLHRSNETPQTIKSLEKDFIEHLKNTVQAASNILVKSPGISRDSFRTLFRELYHPFVTLWDTFDGFKRNMMQAFGLCTTRADMDIIKDLNGHGPKKYLITSVIAGFELNQNCLNSIKAWCESENGEFILLCMRGSSIYDYFTFDFIKEYTNNIATEVSFNKNLKAYDFNTLPQSKLPLTGLHRFGQKKTSIIIASPKQFMASVCRGEHKYPHILYTTGTISNPNYRNNTQGRIAHQDHTFGGLIVEVKDDETFFVRNIEMTSKGEFKDIDKTYTPTGEVNNAGSTAYVLGDIHYGMEDPEAIKCAKEVITRTKPKYIIFHDLCDLQPINHHTMHQITTRHTYSYPQNTLFNVLEHTGKAIEGWSEEFPDSTLVVIPSNHDVFIETWLNSGEFLRDRENIKIGTELLLAILNKHNPLEYYINTYHSSVKNILFLKRGDDFEHNDCVLGHHGDRGGNGGKASAATMELSYGKCIHGNLHTPYKYRDVICVGVNSTLHPQYTSGYSSGWLHMDAILHSNGQRQTILKINGEYTISENL